MTRRRSLIMLAVFAAWHLAALHHLSHEAHRICPEHGDVLHGSAEHHHGHGEPAGEHDHEGDEHTCSFVTFLTKPSLHQGPDLPLIDGQIIAVALVPAPIQSAVADQRELFRLSPAQSPPFTA